MRRPGRSALTLAILLPAILTLARADAQPSGSVDMPQQRERLTVNATNGRLLSGDARHVPAGRHYLAVRIDVAQPQASPGDRVSLPVTAFRLVSSRGLIYSPTTDAVGVPIGQVMGAPCGSIYLVAARPVTCDLVFLVPTDVTAGMLEFAPSPFEVIPIPLTIRK